MSKRYKFVKLLGKGGFGKVSLYKDTKKEKLVVFKILKAEKIESEDLKQYDYYISICNKIDGIINLEKYFFKRGKLILIYEYFDCIDLSKVIDYTLILNKNLSENFILNFSIWLLQTIEKLHENNIVHLDIKPENILYNKKEKKFYLIDFCNSYYHNLGKLKIGGTYGFMAPELYYYYKNKITKEFDFVELIKMDVWSSCITILNLYYKKFPLINKSYGKKISIQKKWIDNNIPDFLFLGLNNNEERINVKNLKELILYELNKIKETNFKN